jgi:hypothetical protein
MQLLKNIGRKAGEIACSHAVGVRPRPSLRNQDFDIGVVVEGDGIRLARAWRRKERENCGSTGGPGPPPFACRWVPLTWPRPGWNTMSTPGLCPRNTVPSSRPYRRDFTVNALAIHLHPEHFGSSSISGAEGPEGKYPGPPQPSRWKTPPSLPGGAFEQRIRVPDRPADPHAHGEYARMELGGFGKRLPGTRFACRKRSPAGPETPEGLPAARDLPFRPEDRSFPGAASSGWKVVSWYRLLYGEN